LLELIVLLNGYTTESPLPSTFLGYSVYYDDIDFNDCYAETTTVISYADESTTDSPLSISFMGFLIQYYDTNSSNCDATTTTTTTYLISTEAVTTLAM
ncbi:unnamed protein product, partial [Rotaria socialis]